MAERRWYIRERYRDGNGEEEMKVQSHHYSHNHTCQKRNTLKKLQSST